MLKLGRVTGGEDIGLPRNLRRTPQEFFFVDSSGDRTSNSTALKEIKIIYIKKIIIRWETCT